MPTFMFQSMSPRKIVIIPASTNPPGQPACKMLSHFVLSFLNMVATTGLIKASTVPFPRARIKLPQYTSW